MSGGRGCQRGKLDAGTLFLLLVLLAAGCAVWWFYAPQTWRAALRAPLPVPTDAVQRAPALYKWQDAQGRWNITDQPPKDRPYTEVRVDPNTNVLPAGVPPERD